LFVRGRLLPSDPHHGIDAATPIIALLGRADTPTDALEDYCNWLKQALEQQRQPMEILRVPWATNGWLSGLTWLWREARNWRGRWIFLQYTALGWSKRGFPIGAAITIWIARHRGAKCAIVFHDAISFSGPRWIDRFRHSVQVWVMRKLYRLALHSIMTVPVEKLTWLPHPATKAEFIPIAANLSGTLVKLNDTNSARENNFPKTTAIFGVTGPPQLQPEVEFIAQIVRQATEQLGATKLLVLGRNALEAEAQLRAALAGSKVELEVHGVLPADEVEHRLSESDVLLFLRGGISSRRGSALAGIACGLPVIAFEGAETGPPMTEAGVILAPEGDRTALANNLTRVLSDDALRNDLRKRSLEAREKYFSWHVIARKFLQVLNNA
jgi:glycosyltransferase involved in cell wall biosynthesis